MMVRITELGLLWTLLSQRSELETQGLEEMKI